MTISNTTNTLITERLQEIPDNLHSLIVGEFLSSTLHELVEQFNLSEQAAAVLSNEVLLVLLGFSTSNQFSEQLQHNMPNADLGQIPALVNEVDERIFSLAARELQMLEEAINTELNNTETQATKDVDTDANQLADEIAETEAAMQEIPAVRTMQSDQSQYTETPPEAVHTAAGQDELLARDSTATATTQSSDEAPPTPPAPNPQTKPTDAGDTSANTPIPPKSVGESDPPPQATEQKPRWESE